MSSCLGMYIESNIIKYAKVSKDKDITKVEAFGIKFYENLSDGIKQIVEETFSYKVPISINLSGEMYNYFDMFTLLGKQNLPKAIKTEFELFCGDKGYNPNVFETRYAMTENLDDKDKIKVIHISANKLELNKQIQQFESYRLTNVSPISMSIVNLEEMTENSLIVNMEAKTMLTTVINKAVYEVNEIDQGSGEVLSRINLKENSYSKAFEACKNTTIYTAEGQELGQEIEQNHLEDIMPTLYEIVGQVKKKINSSTVKIKNVYLTGTLSCVNNVDLYFQEYLPEVKCEILKPSVAVPNSREINIKDYIEVNSAISLALQGLDEGIAGMNFKKASFYDRLPEWMKIQPGESAIKDKNALAGWFTFDFKTSLTTMEKNLIRTAVALLIMIVVYSSFAVLLQKQILAKEDEASEVISYTQQQIKLAEADKTTIDTKTSDYKTMIQNLQDLNDRISDINKSRNLIPNLLNEIMFIIPEEVQITSIENTTDKHIVINAQASKYEQLGYFKAKLKSDEILSNVVSDSGVKEGSMVKVTIEGDLL